MSTLRQKLRSFYIMHRVKPATAKAYVSALRSLHLQYNYSTSAFDDPRIDLVLKGGKRIHGEGARRIRLPLTSEILSRLVQYIPNDRDDINLKAAFCVTFAGFLRSDEFMWEIWDSSSSQSYLARNHVKFNKDGSVTLTLPASKTDPYRRDTPIQLSQSSSLLCPVRALSTLFRTQPGSPDNPLFSRMFGSFIRSYVIDKVKELLLRAGINSANFSGHSFRKGAAVSAAARGISKENIKLLGRWRSDAVDVYINELAEEDQVMKLLQLNSRLHTTLMSSSAFSSSSTMDHTSSTSYQPSSSTNPSLNILRPHSTLPCLGGISLHYSQPHITPGA